MAPVMMARPRTARTTRRLPRGRQLQPRVAGGVGGVEQPSVRSVRRTCPHCPGWSPDDELAENGDPWRMRHLTLQIARFA